MAVEWKEATLDQLYDFSSGLSKPRSEFGSGYPFLSFKNVFDNYFVPPVLSERVRSSDKEREALSIKRGDVFLTRTSETVDELGMSCVALRDIPDATFNGFTKRLRPKPGSRVVPEFAGYYFRSPEFRSQVYGLSSLSTRASLNNEMLARLIIRFPNKTEQERIGGVLKALDDKIGLNRRMSDTLEAMARALFKSWFVDFEPVRAKAEGRDPSLPNRLADLFPNSFSESELGEIPRDWEVKPLGQVAELLIGGDWGRDAAHDGDVPTRCLRGVDIDRIRVLGWSDAPVRFISRSSLEKRAPEEEDVLVEGSGECGRALAFQYVPRVFSEPVVYSNFCKRLRCRSAATAFYVEFILNDLVQSGEMKNFVTGTAMPNLDHKGLLSGLSILLPPATVLDVFGSLVGTARRRLFSGESLTLGALRDALLPQLISGSLRIELGVHDA